jgi:hypothetical protein
MLTYPTSSWMKRLKTLWNSQWPTIHYRYYTTIHEFWSWFNCRLSGNQ